MDRFADRRFRELEFGLDRQRTERDAGPGRSDWLASPHFHAVTPRVIRWIADARGRVLVRDSGSAGTEWDLPVDPLGYGWKAAFERDDIRSLLRAATLSDRPAPQTIRLIRADGQQRWCLVRMVRARDGRSDHRWCGTLEDIHDHFTWDARALEASLAEAREHYRWAVELSPQVPWVAAPDGMIEEVGPQWRALTGMAPQEALGAGWIAALHPDDVKPTLALWADRLVTGEPVDTDYRIRLQDGSYRWMRARAAARRDAQGRFVRWYGTLEDIHAGKLAQDALTRSEERLRLAVQSAQLGIWDFDMTTGIRSWSPEFRRMLGIGQYEPATAELALSLIHPEDRHRLEVMMEGVRQGRQPGDFEATLRVYRADNGAMRWIASTGWVTLSECGRPLRVVVTFRDMTDEHDAHQRIRWAASHDPMTGMPNRTSWQATLEDMTERAQRTGEKFGLMLLDIDDLKRTNDSLGHDAGDALLCGFASRLATAVPKDAVIGRLGGDEFGLIAPSLTDIRAIEECAERLLDGVRGPYSYAGRSLECGVSIGGAVFGQHGETADEVFKAADLALYASKAAGRGRLTLFHPELRSAAQRRSSMLHMAQQALSDDLIVPYYQPKVDLRTGETLGYEALLRWHHPRLGVQAPATIAAAFDHPELAVALTDRMLDAVIEDVAGWLRAGVDPGRVAINASAADFLAGDFAERVLSRLAHAKVPPEHFEIEVTETVFLGRGTGDVERALNSFSRRGVRISLDDFGTGYASLTHIKQYPVDVLKIDRSFVSNIEHDRGDAAIVDAIVKLGISLGIGVVAEGVETLGQAELLLTHGCPVGQGFYLGLPQPANMVVRKAA